VEKNELERVLELITPYGSNPELCRDVLKILFLLRGFCGADVSYIVFDYIEFEHFSCDTTLAINPLYDILTQKELLYIESEGSYCYYDAHYNELHATWWQQFLVMYFKTRL